MFGIEQEFFISCYSEDENRNMQLQPICFNNKKIDIRDQGDYYCSIGFNNALGRNMIEEAFKNILYSEINVTGLNAEVAPSQWEFQVCSIGIDAADSLILLRYICNRTFEKYNCVMDLSVKPRNDLNGSGCHVNFSTNEMRNEKNMFQKNQHRNDRDKFGNYRKSFFKRYERPKTPPPKKFEFSRQKFLNFPAL